ncbi:MAG: nucleotidyltransferase domain-containing protein [Candidatus Aenigmarchaeota archaeon]|nr:nucleotidyltransferase domain-containing protein [Candidatus Aenigmarchaeota archaeon]
MRKYSTLKKICKDFARKNKSITDIVLFGSFAREKTKPKDIDLALIILEKINAEKLQSQIERKLKLPVHISILKSKSLFKETLWKTIMHEGISLLRGKEVSEMLGFEPLVLFWYNLSKLKQSDKVRFSYALFGRDGKSGILKKIRGKSLGKGVLLVPVKKEDELRKFFFHWEVGFNRRRVLAEI